MSFKRGLAMAVMLLAAGGASATESDKVTGRWAVDQDACAAYFFAANAPLVVTDHAVRWRGDSCRIARMYKTGRDVHIQALCWSEGGERSVPVSLSPHAGRLQLRWDRVVSGDLKRCD
jgi:hypothetical protein